MFSKLFPQRNMLFVLPKDLAFWSDFYFLGLNKDLTGPEHLGPARIPFSCCLFVSDCLQPNGRPGRTGQRLLAVLEPPMRSDHCGHREFVPDNTRPQLCDDPACQDTANFLREARISDLNGKHVF